jgi:hypothetical protein
MQLGENLNGNDRWSDKLLAPVNDTMPDTEDARTAMSGSEPLGESLEGAVLIPHRGIERLIDNNVTLAIAGLDFRLGPMASI